MDAVSALTVLWSLFFHNLTTLSVVSRAEELASPDAYLLRTVESQPSLDLLTQNLHLNKIPQVICMHIHV